jgi:Na+-driven multidrug efflux pump
MIGIAFADILLESGRVINLVVNRAIKASGDARYPLISIVIIQWLIILPLTFILSCTLNLGFLGIWVALAIDECIRGINLYLRWKTKRWQHKSQRLNQSLANPQE